METPPVNCYMGALACPDCRLPLVQLTVRHGPFYGCINFPQCIGSRSPDGTATRSDGRTL